MTELIPFSTVTQLASVYDAETKLIKRLCDDLKHATDRLKKAFFDGQSYWGDFRIALYPAHERRNEGVDAIMDEFKRDAWRSIVDRIGLKKIMSVKKREEFDKQLSSGELPEINEENITGVLMTWAEQAKEMSDEAVKEVFNFLRPFRNEYKTNKRWMVGKKVILRYAVQEGYMKSKYRPNYHREKDLIALDAVFHRLDGKGQLTGCNGQLVDSIASSKEGYGETDYFKWRGCKNGNLHIAFKRLDLVKQLNYTAMGSNELGDDRDEEK